MPVGNEAKKLVAQNSAAKQTSNNVKFEKKSVETNKDVNFYLNNNKSSNIKTQTMENRKLSKEDNDILSAINEVKINDGNIKISNSKISNILNNDIKGKQVELTPEEIQKMKEKYEKNNCDASLKFHSQLNEGKDDGVPYETRLKNAMVGGDPKVKTSSKKENADGTVVETIEYEDGTTSVKTINEDGSYTEKGTCKDGETWEKTGNSYGGYIKTRTMKDGSVCKVTVNPNGDIHAETTSPNGYTGTQDFKDHQYTEDVKNPDGSFHYLYVDTKTGQWANEGGKALGPWIFGGIVCEPYSYCGDNFGEPVKVNSETKE